MLVGGHSAPVTALSWAPDEDRWRSGGGGGGGDGGCSSLASASAPAASAPSSSSSFSSPLRIASGDAEGRVVVWDARAGTQLARLDDVVLAATGSSQASAVAAAAAAAAARERAGAGAPSPGGGPPSSPSPLSLHRLSTGVRALAWGGPESGDTLLVLAAPGLLAAWSIPSSSSDSSGSSPSAGPHVVPSSSSSPSFSSGASGGGGTNSSAGTIRWRREFAPELRLACLTLDPGDPRTMCLHGEFFPPLLRKKRNEGEKKK